jgi:two-component system, NtrC family, sensor kinase
MTKKPSVLSRQAAPPVLGARRKPPDAGRLAVHRASPYRDAGLQRELRALLLGFSRTVSSSLTLASGLETFCEGANRLFGADRTSVWLHDRHAREMVLEASSDQSYLARGRRVSTQDLHAPAAVALRRERAEIVATLTHDNDGLAAVVTVPLKGRRRALGTLVFESVRVDAGTELDLLDRFDETGRQLAAAIENVQLLEGVLRSHRELENTFNSIRDLVAVTDRRGRIFRANFALAERLGTTRNALIDRPMTEVVGPAIARLATGVELESDGEDTAAVTEELQDPILNGTFSVMVSRLLGASREPLGHVLVAREITPRAQLEAERAQLRSRLTQSERLAALGQLVAGIAHELNNPLQGVLGHLELLRGTRGLAPTLRRDVRVVYREADRAAKIIRNLLVFAGSRKLMRRPLSVNQVLSRAITLRAPACRAAHIEVVRHFASLPRVHGDPVLLQQAFFNVMTNAEQALDQTTGGRIEIGTAVEPSLNMIVVTLRDTGPGIPPQVLPRIFEPFYTTKEVGKGIGLGLAIAYGIIQEHGGEIIATNHPDGGALFKIALPIEKDSGP